MSIKYSNQIFLIKSYGGGRREGLSFLWEINRPLSLSHHHIIVCSSALTSRVKSKLIIKTNISNHKRLSLTTPSAGSNACWYGTRFQPIIFKLSLRRKTETKCRNNKMASARRLLRVNKMRSQTPITTASPVILLT